MCGCNSAFDGEDQQQFEDTFDNFNNFVDEEDGYTDFVDDGEEDNFDNFLTKKMRARRKLKKDLVASGLTKQEAKTKALEQIPRDKLKEIIARMKQGADAQTIAKDSSLTPSQQQAISQGGTTALTQVANQVGIPVGTQPTPTTQPSGAIIEDDGDDDTKEAGFLQKNGMTLGIVAGVAVVAFVLWKKGVFGKKG
jgi:hypothetical protein